MLEAVNLSKRYNGTVALDSLNLRTQRVRLRVPLREPAAEVIQRIRDDEAEVPFD